MLAPAAAGPDYADMLSQINGGGKAEFSRYLAYMTSHTTSNTEHVSDVTVLVWQNIEELDPGRFSLLQIAGALKDAITPDEKGVNLDVRAAQFFMAYKSQRHRLK